MIIILINYYLHKNSITLWFFIDSISKSVSIITIVSLLFDKYFWKSKIFEKWLVNVPNLNGKWTGTLKSDWIAGKAGKVLASIDTTLIIKQSLFHTSCMMKTKEMKSNGISDFNIDKDNQIVQLICTYTSVPDQNVQVRSRIHQGTIIFDINEEDNENIILKGNYWTGRKTSGVITLRKVSKG